MMTTATSLREIRQKESLTQIMKVGPETETWLNQDYTDQDIDTEKSRTYHEEKHMGAMQYQEKHTRKLDNGK